MGMCVKGSIFDQDQQTTEVFKFWELRVRVWSRVMSIGTYKTMRQRGSRGEENTSQCRAQGRTVLDAVSEIEVPQKLNLRSHGVPFAREVVWFQKGHHLQPMEEEIFEMLAHVARKLHTATREKGSVCLRQLCPQGHGYRHRCMQWRKEKCHSAETQSLTKEKWLLELKEKCWRAQAGLIPLVTDAKCCG